VPAGRHRPRRIGHDAPVQERQRTLIVVATGAAAAVAAVTANRLLADDGGWFAYVPGTSATFEPSSTGAIWREAAVWLAAIGVWAGLSLWLYRNPPRDS
jgi:hypothetical protein